MKAGRISVDLLVVELLFLEFWLLCLMAGLQCSCRVAWMCFAYTIVNVPVAVLACTYYVPKEYTVSAWRGLFSWWPTRFSYGQCCTSDTQNESDSIESMIGGKRLLGEGSRLL